MLVELSYEVSEQAIQIRLLAGKKAMEMILPEKLSTCVCIFLSEIQLVYICQNRSAMYHLLS
jgi:sugar lactone lactonase YvrE